MLFLTLFACSPDSTPWAYLEDGQYILENSEASIVKRFDIPSVVDGIVDGFDLDGVSSETGDAATCGFTDYVDSNGNQGIDNQLGYLWELLEPVVGVQVESLLQGAINEGRFTMVLELSNLDDLQNDDDVTLRIFPATISPEIGTFGTISPNQTAYYEDQSLGTVVDGLQLIDGVLEAGPFNYILPINILEADFDMDVQMGHLRIEMNDDGGFTGIFSGAAVVEDMLYELEQTDAQDEVAYVAPMFRLNADLAKESGECTMFSMTFSYESVPVYVVRYSDEE